MKNNHLPYKILTILFLFLLTVSAYSQPVTWVKIIGDSVKSMTGVSVVQTYDGGYTILAYKGMVSDDSKMMLLKLDYLGNLQWLKYPADTNINISPKKLVQTKDSGFVILGRQYQQVGAFLLKTDKNGNFLWRKNYPDTAVSEPDLYDFTKTLDNGFILCGDFFAYKSLTVTGYLIKTDSAGNIQWRKSYIDSNYTSFGSIMQFTDSCYYLGVAVYGTSNILHGYAKKLRSNGDVVWTKYLLSNGGAGKQVQVTNSSLAYSSTLNQMGYHYVTTYLDSSSNIIWQKTDSFPQQIFSLCPVFNNGIVVMGFTAQGNTIGIRKLSLTDSTLFSKSFLHPGYTLIGARNITNANDNGFVMTGDADINLKYYLLIIKTDSLFNAPLISNISNLNKTTSNKFELYSNFPNPFNSSTSLYFYLPENDNIRIIIYDVLGRKVMDSGSQFCSKGLNKFLFDSNNYNLSSGIYFLSVEYKGQIKFNKLVLIK